MSMVSRTLQSARIAAALVAALAVSLPSVSAKEAAAARGFHTERLADDVCAFIRDEPPGLAFDSNSVAIIGTDDVIVVDAQSTPAATQAVIAALREVTPKPVSFVINTHSHFDHTTGNAAYRDAYPGVRFIAHAAAVEDMVGGAAERLAQMQEHLPSTIAYFEDLLRRGTWTDGSPLTDEGRGSLASDASLARGYATIPKGFIPVLPTIVVHDRLTLAQGTRRVEIRFLGRAHTAGDLVVSVPDRGVLITGDLLVWPVPLVGTTSFPIDFADTLQALAALPGDVIVPGHGPVMRDRTYLEQVRALLAALGDQTRAAVAHGETLEQARAHITLDDFRRTFAGSSQVRNGLFTTYVVQPGVARAYEQASAR